MMRPYSEDLREHALLLAEQGATIRAIGDALQISPSCVSKWRKLQRETGSLKHGKIGGHKRPVLSGATASWLREHFRSGPFTMRKLKAELAGRGLALRARRGGSASKEQSCQWSRIGRTSPASASAGRPIRAELIPNGWFFSTRHGSSAGFSKSRTSISVIRGHSFR